MSTNNTVKQALDYRQFRDWLSSKEGMVIGMQATANVCPLAVYLRESIPALTQVWVKQRHVEYRMGFSRGSLPLPQWAEMFVKGVDKVSAPLEAEAALRLLPPLELARVETPRPAGVSGLFRSLRPLTHS